jgi:excisionase family DNA binding protein
MSKYRGECLSDDAFEIPLNGQFVLCNQQHPSLAILELLCLNWYSLQRLAEDTVLATIRHSDTRTPPAALTIDETADYLRVCRSTVYKLFREGQLKPARVGGRTLVRRVDADSFLERCVEAA